ncbi:MAG: hypothetical protein LWX83_06995 [Anaerolineae bacterium]|nr:hypothetical protein [Anaerolineae bacterium]
MKTTIFKFSLHQLIRVAVFVLVLFAAIPTPVAASSVQHSVRFTASYVSGNTGTKNVYYVLDGGSSQLLGTVSSGSSINITFSVTFSSSVRVYVQIDDDAIYNEHLYINGDLVSNGSVGNAGLTYSRDDSSAPDGRIVAPIKNSIITQCPVMVRATVSDDDSGIDWVIYLVKFDGLWHQFGTDSSASGESGYGAYWDCSQVADQVVTFRISARDNSGNQADVLGGEVPVALARYKTNTPAPTFTNTNTSTAIPTNTDTPVPTQVPPTATPIPSETPTLTIIAASATPLPGETSVVVTPQPKVIGNPNAPIQIVLCSSFVLPLFLSLAFLMWRNRP